MKASHCSAYLESETGFEGPNYEPALIKLIHAEIKQFKIKCNIFSERPTMLKICDGNVLYNAQTSKVLNICMQWNYLTTSDIIISIEISFEIYEVLSSL